MSRSRRPQQSNDPKWGAPHFEQPKDLKNVQFISDFRNLTKELKSNYNPIPKMRKNLLKP